MVGSPQLVRAWLDGDWSAIEGAFFTEWDEAKHVVTPFDIPDTWLRFRSGDWGSFSPFSFGWWAVATDDFALPDGLLLGTKLLRGTDDPKRNVSDGLGKNKSAGRTIPPRALVRYREWYGEVGGKLTADQVGTGIASREILDKPKLTYGCSTLRLYRERRAVDRREHQQGAGVAKTGAVPQGRQQAGGRNIGDPAKSGPMGGWDQMRARLLGKNGVPMLYVFRPVST